MSQFTPTFKYETDFDGDHVVFVLKRLKRQHLVALMPVMENMNPDEQGIVRMAAGDIAKLMEAAARVLPDCVESMHGLKTAETEGNKPEPIALDTVVSEAYFAPLAAEVLTQLMLKSSMRAKTGDGSDLEKKSGPQPFGTTGVRPVSPGEQPTPLSPASPSPGGGTASGPVTEIGK